MAGNSRFVITIFAYGMDGLIKQLNFQIATETGKAQNHPSVHQFHSLAVSLCISVNRIFGSLRTLHAPLIAFVRLVSVVQPTIIVSDGQRHDRTGQEPSLNGLAV